MPSQNLPPGQNLPRSTPSAHDVDARAVVSFVDVLEAQPQIELHSLMLVRHGDVVAEGWWAPFAPDRLHLLYSLSKAFVSTALGLALAEGRLGLDDTVISHFPELDAEITDPRTRRILVRHLASMAAGHREEQLGVALETDGRDLVRGFLLNPPDTEPGTAFAYSQPCTYTLAAILARRTGERPSEYLRPRLLDPLGIGRVAWQRDASGRELGYSGLHVTTEDIAKLGLLYLQGGRWQGRQVIPQSWVEQATSLQVDNAGFMDPIDWQQGYGFQFWRGRHGYRGDGALSQYCVVLPEHDTVVAMTASTQDMQGVLDAMWTHLLPALLPAGTTVPDGPQADAELATRLTGGEIARVPGAPQPPQSTAAAWATFTGRAAALPLEVALSTSPGADGTAWRATVDLKDLDDTHVHLELPLGTTAWAQAAPPTPDGVPLPLATSAAWADGDTLQFDVAFVETPHRLQVTCRLPERAVSVTWLNAPLWEGPLSWLRAPAY